MLYYVDYRFHIFNNLRNKSAFIIAETQYVTHLPSKWLQQLTDILTSKKKILTENADLRKQIMRINAELQRLNFLKHENEELRSLLHYTEQHNQRFLAAQFLTTIQSGFGQNIVNRGQQDGVYAGQTVIDPYGVLGSVVAVGSNMSAVMLLTQKKSAIPVMVLRNGLQTIAIGTDKEYLKLISIPETADIKVGDQLVTSGLDKTFPSGYQVGTVKNIEKIAGEKFISVTVMPRAHINRALHVFLITSWKTRSLNFKKQ